MKEENILNISTEEEFEHIALETFRRQARNCPPYGEYIEKIGCKIEEVHSIEEIPFLPISLFKSHDIYCGESAPEIIFTSSATTGMTSSHHMMKSLSFYEETFTRAFKDFYGEPQKWSLYALLPNYLRRKGSSLVYMADRLIKACGRGGFYLDNIEQLISDMERDPRPKILLGVSYALWDLVEKYAPKFEKCIIMETGGMKGYREEISKEAFHKILTEGFGVETIHSEYGMAELTSQAYSHGGNRFYCPRWMKVLTRDINDPFTMLQKEMRGGLNIIDLANQWSCAFIQTEDAGKVHQDGSFEIDGRIAHSDIRGCNLLVQ